MSQLFRYVSVVSRKPAAVSVAVSTSKPAADKGCGCNYKDNYYGDQVCLDKAAR
ncbi:hypothetical protein [Oceanobacter mangrovi]|uniref:hypothetical protein n=1 Tax=Oceanobacter mangrovi TaxID=2862510 RepID=UPI001C8ED56A|nr:hypothetical protein [Oceanobacter mangrovi]